MPRPSSVASPGAGGGALAPTCRGAVLPQTPGVWHWLPVELPPAPPASSIPSCRCWHPGGRAVSPPACCRNALGASAGFYLLRLSCFPALFCGQGSLLLLCSSVLSPHFVPGDEECSSGSCSVPPPRFPGICGQQCWSRQKALLCTDRQTDVLCAPGALPGEHGKQMLDWDLLEKRWALTSSRASVVRAGVRSSAGLRRARCSPGCSG